MENQAVRTEASYLRGQFTNRHLPNLWCEGGQLPGTLAVRSPCSVLVLWCSPGQCFPGSAWSQVPNQGRASTVSLERDLGEKQKYLAASHCLSQRCLLCFQARGWHRFMWLGKVKCGSLSHLKFVLDPCAWRSLSLLFEHRGPRNKG